MKISKENILGYLFSVVAIIFILYLVIGGSIKQKSLDLNKEYLNAIVIDSFFTIRQTDYFRYKFFVERKEFIGSGEYYYPPVVGDTILIVYDKTNPNNNSFWRDYETRKKEQPYVIPVLLFLGFSLWWAYKDK